jgi:hypothetical protein
MNFLATGWIDTLIVMLTALIGAYGGATSVARRPVWVYGTSQMGRVRPGPGVMDGWAARVRRPDRRSPRGETVLC